MKIDLLQLIILQLFLLSCTATKPVIDNHLVFKNHQSPFKVFGIGYSGPGYYILTLTDADNKYIIIKTRQNNLVKVGDIYNP